MDGMETQKSQDQMARDFFVTSREREAATILEVRMN